MALMCCVVDFGSIKFVSKPVSGMNIQIIYDEPTCFDSFKAHYSKFSSCKNYIAVVGKKGKELDKKWVIMEKNLY